MLAGFSGSPNQLGAVPQVSKKASFIIDLLEELEEHSSNSMLEIIVRLAIASNIKDKVLQQLRKHTGD